MPASMFEQIALHLGISAAVSLFVAETSEDLGGGMALLGRGGLVVAEGLVDERLDRSGRGASRSRVEGRGSGSACLRILRIVLREWSNSLAI